MHKDKGAAILLYVTMVSVVAFLLLLASQSRFLLAVKRNQSALDNLQATTRAESEINDFLAKIVGGYIKDSDFPITRTYEDQSTKVDLSATFDGEIQTIEVKTNKGFASIKVQATREIRSIDNADRLDLVLALDCTSSMDLGANCVDCQSRPTRMDALKEATKSFVESVDSNSNSNKFKLGLMVFGIDSKWADYEGLELKPGAVDNSTLVSAIETNFGSTRSESPACLGVMDATSVGSPFSGVSSYFDSIHNTRIKKIFVMITDGLPNSTPRDTKCDVEFCPAFPKSSDGEEYCESNEYGWTCYKYDTYKDGPWGEDNYNQKAFSTCEPISKDHLKCSLADTSTFIPELGRYGTRNEDLEVYSVSIYNNTPIEIASILRDYSTSGGYYNAQRASELEEILDNIYRTIIKDRSIIRIKRIL